jgi:hypothetical protein
MVPECLVACARVYRVELRCLIGVAVFLWRKGTTGPKALRLVAESIVYGSKP